MRRQGRRIPGRSAGLRRRLALAALAALGGTGTLAIAGIRDSAGEPRSGGGGPGAAEHRGDRDRRPNARVDARDGQRQLADRGSWGEVHAELRQLRALLPLARHLSHRPVHAQPRRVRQRAAERRVPPLPGPARQQPPGGLASPCRVLHRDDRQVPERLPERTPGAAGLDRVARGGPEHAGGLRLHAERERHPRPLRHRSSRLQAGRPDPQGRGPCQPPGAGGAAVLPLAHLHGPPLRRSEPEPEPALQLPGRPRSRRPATPTRSTPSRCGGRRTSTRPTSPTSRPRSEPARV